MQPAKHAVMLVAQLNIKIQLLVLVFHATLPVLIVSEQDQVHAPVAARVMPMIKIRYVLRLQPVISPIN
jgi:hypothetical protein